MSPEELFDPLAEPLPKGVLFDMDGTLLETERAEISLYVKLSEEMGWPADFEMVTGTLGITDEESQVYFRARFGPDYPALAIWKKVHAEFIRQAEREGIACRPGLPLLLDRLESLGIPAAVATSTARPLALWKLEKAGIAGRFPVVVCGDEVEHGKPAPDIFIEAARRLGLAPKDCLGFEDSPSGLLSLAVAGIRSVFVKDLAEPPSEVLRTVWRRCADLEVAAELFGGS